LPQLELFFYGDKKKMSKLLNKKQIETLTTFKNLTDDELETIKKIKFETFTLVDADGRPFELTDDGWLIPTHANLRDSLEDKGCLHAIN